MIGLVIENDVVVNTIAIDKETPKELYTMVLPEGESAGIGWTYKDGKFIAPPEPEEEQND